MDQQQQQKPATDQNQDKNSQAQEKTPGQQTRDNAQSDKKDQAGGLQRAEHERENQKQR